MVLAAIRPIHCRQPSAREPRATGVAERRHPAPSSGPGLIITVMVVAIDGVHLQNGFFAQANG